MTRNICHLRLHAALVYCVINNNASETEAKTLTYIKLKKRKYISKRSVRIVMSMMEVYNVSS